MTTAQIPRILDGWSANWTLRVSAHQPRANFLLPVTLEEPKAGPLSHTPEVLHSLRFVSDSPRVARRRNAATHSQSQKLSCGRDFCGR